MCVHIQCVYIYKNIHLIRCVYKYVLHICIFDMVTIYIYITVCMLVPIEIGLLQIGSAPQVGPCWATPNVTAADHPELTHLKESRMMVKSNINDGKYMVNVG